MVIFVSINIWVINKVQIKDASLRRFLNVGLAVGEPTCWCHQTLTFKDEKHSIGAVKEPLNLLLDSLHKRFQMASLYTIESGENERLHVHVFFLFYDSLPFDCEGWLEKFRPVVFKAWNKLNGGRLRKAANVVETHPELDSTYFIKYVETLPRDVKKGREKANWWGVRNKKLLNQHRVPVDQERLKEIMRKSKAPKYSKPRRLKPNQPEDWMPQPLLEDDPILWKSQKKPIAKRDAHSTDESLMLLAMIG